MKTRLLPVLAGLAIVILLALAGFGESATTLSADPLPSWNDGSAKKAILEFVKTTTDKSNPNFVPPEGRIATFDEDGTTWVEHPVYTEVVFSIDRLRQLAPRRPEWHEKPYFKAVIDGDREVMRRMTMKEFVEIVAATHTGITTDEFDAISREWLAKARHPRWNKPYTDLAYLPMLEVMALLRANGYKTYIVTGGTQPFVRAFAEKVYGIPPEQVIGSAVTTKFTPTKTGNVLMLDPKLLLNNNYAGKAEDIYLFLGRRPKIAFGNTEGDAEMLASAQASGGANAQFLVLHDDAKREYAYGPAGGLPDTHVGTFSQSLYDEAKKRGWHVISMKNDWKRLFTFEP